MIFHNAMYLRLSGAARTGVSAPPGIRANNTLKGVLPKSRYQPYGPMYTDESVYSQKCPRRHKVQFGMENETDMLPIEPIREKINTAKSSPPDTMLKSQAGVD
jgi:hypothetical protein